MIRRAYWKPPMVEVRVRMPRAVRAPQPWLLAAVFIVPVAVAAVFATRAVTAVHRASLAEERACAAELELWKVRNPRLAAGLVEQPDRCRMLAAARGR